MMYSEPKMWFALMDKLGDMVIDYTKAQVNAGAKAIQIFDSWVGAVNGARLSRIYSSGHGKNL